MIQMRKLYDVAGLPGIRSGWLRLEGDGGGRWMEAVVRTMRLLQSLNSTVTLATIDTAMPTHTWHCDVAKSRFRPAACTVHLECNCPVNCTG